MLLQDCTNVYELYVLAKLQIAPGSTGLISSYTLMSQVRSWLPWVPHARLVFRGSKFTVFAIEDRIAIKCATLWQISDKWDISVNSVNRACLEEEMAAVLSLNNRTHPNVIKYY